MGCLHNIHAQQACNALLCLVFKVIVSLNPTRAIAPGCLASCVQTGTQQLIIAKAANHFCGNFVLHLAAIVLLQPPHQLQQQIRMQQQHLQQQRQRQPLEPQVVKNEVFSKIFEPN